MVIEVVCYVLTWLCWLGAMLLYRNERKWRRQWMQLFYAQKKVADDSIALNRKLCESYVALYEESTGRREASN